MKMEYFVSNTSMFCIFVVLKYFGRSLHDDIIKTRPLIGG